MKAKKLYQQLEKDFIKPSLKDDWKERMRPIFSFITKNFKKRSMGLVCDNADEIHKVYTAVFPTREVMLAILNKNESGVMLFIHHPAVWDITKAPNVFQSMDKDLLKKFRQKRIAIYNLHVPLDNYGRHSTSVSLAKALGIKPVKAFAPYFGGLAGVFGKTKLKTVKALIKKIEKVVHHKVKLYSYGTNQIKNGKVALIAGGGNMPEEISNIAKADINTFITGVTRLSKNHKPFVKAHFLLKRLKINLIGATHYSTEKFACMAMCRYFLKLGLPSEFIGGKPGLEDL